jgi:hypothetical protein
MRHPNSRGPIVDGAHIVAILTEEDCQRVRGILVVICNQDAAWHAA